MRDVRPGYLVRDAGSPSRPGRVFKMYPYTLRSLLDALDDARLRSYADGPQVVVRAEGRTRVAFRRYEHGREVPVQPADKQIAANTAFVERIANEKRGQAFGLANAGLIVGQGVAFAVAGAAAEVVPPSTVVALSGGIGALVACGLALRWRGMSPAVGRHTARHLGREASLTRQTPIQSGSL